MYRVSPNLQLGSRQPANPRHVSLSSSRQLITIHQPILVFAELPIAPRLERDGEEARRRHQQREGVCRPRAVVLLYRGCLPPLYGFLDTAVVRYR
ncbi:hypothetical protein J6590_064157 [Homalodisca vitripennis]|nr:hypothetical protein J6590_064157 [Homalodisca vitripennis]